MMGKIEYKEDRSSKLKKSFVTLIQKWLGKVQMGTTLLDKVCQVRTQNSQVHLAVKAEPKGNEKMRF